MKVRNLFLGILLITALVVPESCSKYQDGPFISFRSKTKRLAGTWKYSAFVFLDINETETENLPETRFTFTEDGGYFSTDGDTGTWEMGDGVDLILNFKHYGQDSTQTFEILRLANKELWLKTDEEELHFVAD